jgi:UDPglucose--hexose-1-phosphate uridylyltransferase
MHADWDRAISGKYRALQRPLSEMAEAELDAVLRDEVGHVFCGVLEDCGVFKRDSEGKQAFLRFIDTIDR